jgi:hypothetical protein
MKRREFMERAAGFVVTAVAVPFLPRAAVAAPVPAAPDRSVRPWLPSEWAARHLRMADGQPFQATAAQRPFMDEGERSCWTSGFRPVGKTTALTVLALWYALEHPESRVLFACPTRVQCHMVWYRIEEWVRHSPALWVGGLPVVSQAPAGFRLRNGSQIHLAVPGDPTKGTMPDCLLVDNMSQMREGWAAVAPVLIGMDQELLRLRGRSRRGYPRYWIAE